MKHLDLFSGIGGFALAARNVWQDEYENVGHSEVEEFPCKVYHKHFPESECLGDITKIKWQEGQADIVTGGFPCQPHSIAGKRKGSKDSRDLWSECVRAVCGVRPRYALFENVPALFTSDDGRFFNRVLADLAKIGYDAEWQTISAASVGAPHLRERIWIVAYTGHGNVSREKDKTKYEISAGARDAIKPERPVVGDWLRVVADSTKIHDGRYSRKPDERQESEFGKSIINRTSRNAEGNSGDQKREIQKRQTAIAGRSNSEPEPSSSNTNDTASTRQRGNSGKILSITESERFNDGDCDASNTESRETQPTKQRGFYTESASESWRENWIEVATRLCRVDDGVRNRVDRLKALGNAIVPQVAEEIFKRIKAHQPQQIIKGG